jgi:cellulose synthase/poly-beta-1,6-N-acetylglucosamine synthase-like glycosyltransferase
MLQAAIIISILLFTSYAVLIIFYAISWHSIPSFVEQKNDAETTPAFLSIIIPARNETLHIKACLTALQQQTYPTHLYEVIVVDDHSDDDTATIVKNFPASNVQLISLKDFVEPNAINSYKKKAIEVALLQAKGELIITTDADCTMPSAWLQTIAAFYRQTNAALIVMPVAFTPINKSFGVKLLSIFQSLDFMVLQGITGASVYKKAHSMCNGANLAYTKAAYIAVDGFKGIDAIASGDDMLLMHKIFSRYPDGIKFLQSPKVIVQTQPANSMKAFFNQRIRWASKADKYDDKRITAVLALVYFFNVWILLLFFIAPFNGSFGLLLLAVLLTKTLLELILLYPVANFFSGKKLLLYFPLAQPFHVCYTVIAGWLGKFGTYQWKGRKVK